MKHMILLAALSSLGVFSQLGCHGKRERPIATVSGTVTVGDQPVSAVVLTLEPMSGTSGPNASVPVWNGGFEISQDAGLHGGRYRVRFSMVPFGIREKIPRNAGMTLPPADAVIAPKYNSQSQTVCELTPSENNILHFRIEFQ